MSKAKTDTKAAKKNFKKVNERYQKQLESVLSATEVIETESGNHDGDDPQRVRIADIESDLLKTVNRRDTEGAASPLIKDTADDAQEAVEGTSSQLLEAIESLDAGFVMYSADGRLLVCNNRYKDLFAGAAHLMAPGALYETILRETYRQGNYTASGLSEDEWVASRLALHNAAGSQGLYEQLVGQRWIRINDSRTRDGNIVSLYTDITESKRIQESLRESEERFRSILENIEDGYYEVNTAGNLIFFNPALSRMLGRPEHELMGMNNRMYMTPEGAKAVYQTYNRVFQTGIPEQALDWAVVRPDGLRRSVEVSVSLMKNAEGTVTGFRGIVRDITRRRQIESTITKRAAELQAVAEISTAASRAATTQQMLREVVDLTKSRLQLYHAHIYLLDELGENLVLSAGAGDVGAQMVARGHSIPLTHPHSLVARAARTRHGAISNNVIQEPDFLPNPLLPDTRSELATPLVVGDTVLGVFDVQSDVTNHFSSEDIAIQTTLAQQLGAALQNIRSLERAETLVTELNDLTHGLVREGWSEYKTRELANEDFVYDLAQIPESTDTATTKPELIAMPLAVRGEVIGEIAVIDRRHPHRGADVVAQTSSRIVIIPGQSLRHASDATRMHFYKSFLLVLAQRLSHTNLLLVGP